VLEPRGSRNAGWTLGRPTWPTYQPQQPIDGCSDRQARSVDGWLRRLVQRLDALPSTMAMTRNGVVVNESIATATFWRRASTMRLL